MRYFIAAFSVSPFSVPFISAQLLPMFLTRVSLSAALSLSTGRFIAFFIPSLTRHGINYRLLIKAKVGKKP